MTIFPQAVLLPSIDQLNDAEVIAKVWSVLSRGQPQNNQQTWKGSVDLRKTLLSIAKSEIRNQAHRVRLLRSTTTRSKHVIAPAPAPSSSKLVACSPSQLFPHRLMK